MPWKTEESEKLLSLSLAVFLIFVFLIWIRKQTVEQKTLGHIVGASEWVHTRKWCGMASVYIIQAMLEISWQWAFPHPATIIESLIIPLYSPFLLSHVIHLMLSSLWVISVFLLKLHFKGLNFWPCLHILFLPHLFYLSTLSYIMLSVDCHYLSQ